MRLTYLDDLCFDRRYDVLYPIGSGGSGDVYMVKDRVTSEICALKVLRIEEIEFTEQPRFRKRFAHEARALEQLRHERVIALKSFRAKRDAPYLVLEYFEGGMPFLRLSSQQPVERVEWLELAVMLFDALDYVHTHGIMHRDISSGNVLVRGSREKRELKLIDFGIALGPSINRITRTGGSIGKTGAIDPYVLRREGKGWSTKSDIYSAGVMLYRALLGRSPHNVPTQDRLAQLSANCENVVTPPSHIDPHIPFALENFLLDLLETSPYARPNAKDACDRARRLAASLRQTPKPTAVLGA